MIKITRRQAEAFRSLIRKLQNTVTDEDALTGILFFDPWKDNTEYKAGDRIRYNGVLYKVVQAHTSQQDWTPDMTPALYTEVSIEEWPEWKQPTGTQDAYNKGDKVSYEDSHYISLMDGNVWSPTAYPAGWEKVS